MVFIYFNSFTFIQVKMFIGKNYIMIQIYRVKNLGPLY